jgi:hypothetical protein
VDESDLRAPAAAIVAAIARRSEQDSGMTFDQVQSLLVRRVQDEASRLGVKPRALMGAVWRIWESESRAPILGEAETARLIERLVERDLLRFVARNGAEPALVWCGLDGEALEAHLATLDPPLDHAERLLVESVRRHLAARAAGAYQSWEIGRAAAPAPTTDRR